MGHRTSLFALALVACSSGGAGETHPSDAGEHADVTRHDAARHDSGLARADAGLLGSTDAGPFASCKVGGDGSYITTPFPNLSQYCITAIVDDAIALNPAAVPYDLNTPLFSDYAIKVRGVWVPSGKTATYDPTLAFEFPTGTILTKSFGFADDMRKTKPVVRWVETRLLINTGSGWETYTYLWDTAGKEATLSYAGEVLPLSWFDADGGVVDANYLVPSFNECKECHGLSGAVTPIGPKAREINKAFDYADGGENELAHWTRVGILSGAPDAAAAPKLPVWNDPTTGTEEARARAYLEANCAHCHNPDGFAGATGLDLFASVTNPTTYGICKPPVAAGPATGGRQFDVVPGAPDASIMVYRLASTTPEIMMPLIGRSVVDVEGLALIEGWIGGLDGGCP